MQEIFLNRQDDNISVGK